MRKKFKEWMGKTNGPFTALAGEPVKNSEVVYAHLGIVVFLIVLGIAGNF